MREWGSWNLIRELVLKDLKVRYSRPSLGFLWVFLSPLLIVVIFYIVFGLFLKVKIPEAPFVLYLMSGIFPWIFFQDSILKSTTSLMDNKNLIKESGFPHYMIPVSIVFANFINYLPSLLIMIISSSVILRGLPLLIFLLPFTLMIHLSITMGLSVIFSILYVRQRDVKYALDAVLLLFFYLSPVFYSISSVKIALTGSLFIIYINNPLTGMLNLYRITVMKGVYPIIENNAGFVSIIFIPFISGILILCAGFWLYRKNRDIINDYLAY
jgi:ABC-2 type transport system permease protein